MTTTFRGQIGQIGRPTFIYRAGVPKRIHYRNADGGDGHDRSAVNRHTSCRNLVRFGAVTPEFTCLICVWQTSICAGISVTTFARWRHCWAVRRSVSVLFLCNSQLLFHYYSLGGETAMPGELHTLGFATYF